MTDEEIEKQRVAGLITWHLKNDPPEKRESLLLYIEYHCGIAERLRLEAWIAEGMPSA